MTLIIKNVEKRTMNFKYKVLYYGILIFMFLKFL